MNCPICRQHHSKVVISLSDDRYGYPGMFDLMRCTNCGHLFLNFTLTPRQLGELYTCRYPRKTFNLDQFKPHTEKRGVDAWFNGLNSSAFRRVPKNVRVLDVGCGFGQSLGYHAARDCDVYGVEADANIKRVAEKFGYKVHVGPFDDSIYEPGFFDYVTMDQVIEHVVDPLSTFRGIARVLKPGGTAILSTPNAGGWGARIFGRRWINWHAPYHMQFFSRRSMRLAAEQTGFAVLNVETITNSEWLLYQWIHFATYPPSGEASHFWMQNHQKMTSLQGRILGTLGFLHKCRFNHLLTRLFDSIGLGDNYVFILKKK